MTTMQLALQETTACFWNSLAIIRLKRNRLISSQETAFYRVSHYKAAMFKRLLFDEFSKISMILFLAITLNFNEPIKS